MGSNSIVVVDHSLKGFEGHHFEYSLASAKALSTQGASVVVSCHKTFGQKSIEGINFQPDFSVGWTDSTRFEKARLWLQIFFRSIFGRLIPSFYGRFGSELAKVVFARGQEVFIHTLSFTQLAEVFEIIPQQAKPGKFHIVLRYDPGEGGLKNHLLKMMFRYARSQNFDVQYYSDTPELCAELGKNFGIQIKLLPILFESLRPNPHLQTPIKVSYLGDAREEKGFQHLPQIIKDVLPEAPNVQFLIQVHLSRGNQGVPSLTAAVDEIKLLASRDPQRVVLLNGSLGPKDYRELVEKTDVILLPYDAKAYRWRSSGILVQGAAAGKVVIVPKGTSMETMVERDSNVTFASPGEIPNKLIAICKSWPEFHNNAIQKAQSWQSKHSPESFARQILTSR